MKIRVTVFCLASDGRAGTNAEVFGTKEALNERLVAIMQDAAKNLAGTDPDLPHNVMLAHIEAGEIDQAWDTFDDVRHYEDTYSIEEADIEVDWRPPQLAKLRELWPTGLVSLDLHFDAHCPTNTGERKFYCQAYAAKGSPSFSDEQPTIEAAIADLITLNKISCSAEARLNKVAALRQQANAGTNNQTKGKYVLCQTKTLHCRPDSGDSQGDKPPRVARNRDPIQNPR